MGVCLFGWCVVVCGQETVRSGLDSPRLRVAVADFRAIGGDAEAARRVSAALAQAMGAIPLLELVGGEEVAQALRAAEAEVLALKPGAARALGDKIGADAVVFGRVVTDLSALMEEPVTLASPLVQLVVAETLTLDGQLYPGVPLPLSDDVSALTAAALDLLPAWGRVLAIVESPEGVSIQLFPLAGRLLPPATELGVYDPADCRMVSPDPSGRSGALARQDLRPGVLTGRVVTAAAADDHAIGASSSDPMGRVSVGQLVGLPPMAGFPRPTGRGPVVLVSSGAQEAVVFVGARVVGVTPVAVPLETGVPTTLQIARRDHRPEELEITPGEGGMLAAVVMLEEIPPLGSLRVVSEPPGASVRIGVRELGQTPLVVENLPAGEHEVRVALEGHKTVVQTVTIPRQKLAELSVTLVKDLKRVRIESRPEGALVSLDGEEVGVTPVVIEQLQTGQHELRLSLPGHATEKRTVRVRPEEGEQNFLVELRALAGNLRVETTPPGATVAVDGTERGQTPLALMGLPIGQHQVSLTLEGHLPVSRTVEIQDQELAVVQEKLVRAEGSIAVRSVPRGARVVLDGEDKGVTPRTLEHVPVGMRMLSISLEGYRTWTARVPVAHGQTTKVEVGLIRQAEGGD